MDALIFFSEYLKFILPYNVFGSSAFFSLLFFTELADLFIALDIAIVWTWTLRK